MGGGAKGKVIHKWIQGVRECVRTDAGGCEGMNEQGEQRREDGKRECPKTQRSPPRG